MVALLDVNVIVALAWPNHVHHESAHRWFSRNAPTGHVRAGGPGAPADFHNLATEWS